MDNNSALEGFNTTDYLIYRETVNFVYYLILIPVAFLGNLFTVIIVSFIVRHQRTRRSIPDVFLGLLAGVDLFSIVFIHSISAAAEGKGLVLLPTSLCEYQAFAISLYLKLQFLLQIMICLDRHFALVRPLQYRKFSSFRTMKLLLLGVFVVGIGTTALTYATSFRHGEPLRTWTLCRFSWKFSGITEYLVVGATMFVICLGFLAFLICNVTLVRILWHYHQQKTNLVWKEIRNAVNEMKNSQKKENILNATANCHHIKLVIKPGENKCNMQDSPLSGKSSPKIVKENGHCLDGYHGDGSGSKSVKVVPKTVITAEQVDHTIAVKQWVCGNGLSDPAHVQRNQSQRLSLQCNLVCDNQNNNAKENLDCASNKSTASAPIITDTKQAITFHVTEYNEQNSKCSQPSPEMRGKPPEFKSSTLDTIEHGTKADHITICRKLSDGLKSAVVPQILIKESECTSSKNTETTEFVNSTDIVGLTSQQQLPEGHQHSAWEAGIKSCDKEGFGNLAPSVSEGTRSSLTSQPSFIQKLAINAFNSSSSGEGPCKSPTSPLGSNERESPKTLGVLRSEETSKNQASFRGESVGGGGPGNVCQTNALVSRDKDNLINNASMLKETCTEATSPAASPPYSTVKGYKFVLANCNQTSDVVTSEKTRGDVLIQHSSGTPDIVIDPPSGGSLENQITHAIPAKLSEDTPLSSAAKLGPKKSYSSQKSNESVTLDHVQQQVKKVLKKIHKTAYKQQREIFLARIVLLCAIVFILSWLPYAVVLVMYLFQAPVNPILEDVASRCIFANAMLNPIFYGLSRKNYRQGYDYIMQAFCHILSFGCIHPPGEDKVFFESRKRKQKRHLEAMRYMQRDAEKRRISTPAIQILQQTLLLRSHSLRPSDNAHGPHRLSTSTSPPKSASPDFHPSKQLQDLFQRYIEDSDSTSDEDFSSIDYEALICDDSEMYQNIKKVLSVFTDLNELNSGSPDEDIDLDIDYEALVYKRSLSRSDERHLLSTSDIASVHSETALDQDLHMSEQKYSSNRLRLHPHDFIRQRSCPENSRNESFL